MKAKFGAIVVAGSGKVGGHVFSKNRGGAYMRTKVTPNNPQTVAQQNARALLSSLSTQWAELTEPQRLSWNSAVADFATTDIFGDLKNPSGFNLFVKLNANLANVGEAQVLSAPAKGEVPYAEFTEAIFDLSTSTVSLGFDGVAYDTVSLLVSATPSVSAGKSNVSNLFKVITVTTGAGVGADVFAAYVAKFGAPLVGANITFRVQPVIATGQKGTPQTVKALVQL